MMRSVHVKAKKMPEQIKISGYAPEKAKKIIGRILSTGGFRRREF